MFASKAVFYSRFQFTETFFADDFTLEKLCIVHASAENTSGFIFFQYDGIFIHEDFDRILAGKREIFSDFDGKNDSSEFINTSDDSC